MYPVVRVDKLHPDGSLRAAWFGYRLPDDVDGWTRVWTPPFTPRAHIRGAWTPGEPLLTAFSTTERFVPHLYWDPDGPTFYVDVVRETRITEVGFSYVDLYVDVIFHGSEVTSKDEELLERLDPAEARTVKGIRDGLIARVKSHDALFDSRAPLWMPPTDARDLVPRAAPWI